MTFSFARRIVPPTPPTATRVLAVIGTAGRDRERPMTQELWLAMTTDLRGRVDRKDHLVSGGAAWADHLAVHAYLNGWVDQLTLYLPAPFERGTFLGPTKSAASAANFYHEKFSAAIGDNSRQQIALAITRGAQAEYEPPAAGYSAMFARNKKVAKLATACLAYTFGEGQDPADGGTLNTWQQIQGDDRVHVALSALIVTAAPALDSAPHSAERPRFRFGT